jgi:hypothetical protein
MNILQRLMALIASLLGWGSSDPPISTQPAQEAPAIPFDPLSQLHPPPTNQPFLPLSTEVTPYDSPAQPHDTLDFNPLPFDPLPNRSRG